MSLFSCTSYGTCAPATGVYYVYPTSSFHLTSSTIAFCTVAPDAPDTIIFSAKTYSLVSHTIRYCSAILVSPEGGLPARPYPSRGALSTMHRPRSRKACLTRALRCSSPHHLHAPALRMTYGKRQTLHSFLISSIDGSADLVLRIGGHVELWCGAIRDDDGSTSLQRSHRGRHCRSDCAGFEKITGGMYQH